MPDWVYFLGTFLIGIVVGAVSLVGLGCYYMSKNWRY